MGAGRDPGTLQALGEFVRAHRGQLPMVVDADALFALPPDSAPTANLVATPNAGEYTRLFGAEAARSPEDRLEGARKHAADWGLTLLAKGESDLITDGTTGYLNSHHHPSATVAGAGDVLAGVVGGLLAQGLSGIDAARLSAYWVGEAGIIAAESRGPTFLASELLDALSPALLGGLKRLRGESRAQA